MSTGMITNSNYEIPSCAFCDEVCRPKIKPLIFSDIAIRDGSSIKVFMRNPEESLFIDWLKSLWFLPAATKLDKENKFELVIIPVDEGANGVYSANDRLEIQKEIDQLKEEIDRISETTQFNTKKLINGESSGAWNSGTDKISAVINGTVADGNYDINFNVKPGQNQVQSTQIFTLREGKLGAYVGSQGTTNIGQVSNPYNIQDTKRNLSPSFTVSAPASIGISKFKLKPLELYEPCNLPFTDVKSNHWPSSPFSAEINFTL